MDLTYNLESRGSYQSAMQIRTMKNMAQAESTLMTMKNDIGALKYNGKEFAGIAWSRSEFGSIG